MRQSSASDIVLKALGLLLLTAVALKGHELLTVPVASKDLWSRQPFPILQVGFEPALGIWLLSGLFNLLVTGHREVGRESWAEMQWMVNTWLPEEVTDEWAL